MLRKLYLVPVLALLMVPAIASAQFEQGNFSLEIAGSGGNDHDFDTGFANLDFELGYFLTKELMVGIRQGLDWSDGGSIWNGSTRVVGNFHFDMDKWQPYGGGSIGYTYGETTNDSWIAGLEVGTKYFVNSTTYIDVRAGYDFDLEEGIDDGAFVYGLGLGFRW